nr:hypothetical protein HGMM_F04D09C20 [uncultured Gammaproteobacteria bacterium]
MMTLNERREYEDVTSYTTVTARAVVDHLIRLGTLGRGTAVREEPHRRSIMELQGLGREVWKGIDAKGYIDELRDEWDHR